MARRREEELFRDPMMKKFNLSSSSLTLVSFLLLFIHPSAASIHDYRGEKFMNKGNAFVHYGDSEGLYASLPNPNDSSVTARGGSFIR